nr:hypothetical protein [Morchella crassipes]
MFKRGCIDTSFFYIIKKILLDPAAHPPPPFPLPPLPTVGSGGGEGGKVGGDSPPARSAGGGGCTHRVQEGCSAGAILPPRRGGDASKWRCVGGGRGGGCKVSLYIYRHIYMMKPAPSKAKGG